MNESEKRILEIAREVGLDYLQLHGDELPSLIGRLEQYLPVIKAVRARKTFRPAKLARYKRASAILLDGYSERQRGGTGKTFDWELARRSKSYGRIFLAGGLTPENVREAIRIARPYAIDVCSGIEKKPGKKDPGRMKDFMRAVRSTARRKAAR